MTLIPPPIMQSTSRGEKIATHRQANVMLSRVAACLYWMSRYLERAENIARLLDVNLQLILDFGRIDDEKLTAHWLPILQSAGNEALFHNLYGTANSHSVTEFLTFRAENPNSVWSCISAARENARQVRDQISREMWEVLNEAYLFLNSPDGRETWENSPGAFYERVKHFSHLFQGMTDSTFSRNEGYEFLQFGKLLERADKTSRILDVKYHILLPKVTDVGGAVDTAQWQAVLRSASALEAYRRFYVAEILPWKVAEFLIFSETFPRSIRYCLEQLSHHLQRISDMPVGTYNSAVERKFGKFLTNLSFNTVEDVFRQGLHEFLTETRQVLEQIATHVYQTFMYHPPIDVAAEIRLHQQEQQQQ